MVVIPGLVLRDVIIKPKELGLRPWLTHRYDFGENANSFVKLYGSKRIF